MNHRGRARRRAARRKQRLRAANPGYSIEDQALLMHEDPNLSSEELETNRRIRELMVRQVDQPLTEEEAQELIERITMETMLDARHDPRARIEAAKLLGRSKGLVDSHSYMGKRSQPAPNASRWSDAAEDLRRRQARDTGLEHKLDVLRDHKSETG